jgi:hypothetical protein
MVNSTMKGDLPSLSFSKCSGLGVVMLVANSLLLGGGERKLEKSTGESGRRVGRGRRLDRRGWTWLILGRLVTSGCCTPTGENKHFTSSRDEQRTN